jgi:hypothetical protein
MMAEKDWDDFAPGSSEALPLRAELAIELARGHELFGSEIAVVARRYAQDDILVTVADRDGCAAVHLTWKESGETPPFPITIWYASVEAAKHALDDS